MVALRKLGEEKEVRQFHKTFLVELDALLNILAAKIMHKVMQGVPGFTRKGVLLCSQGYLF